MFTLTEVECLGACANAPMIQINNHEFYVCLPKTCLFMSNFLIHTYCTYCLQENLTPETTVKLLDDLRAGKPVKVGPQNGQVSCEGIMGRTTLKNPDAIKPVVRDLDALKAAHEKAKQEAAAKAAADAAAKAAAAPAAAAGAAPKK